MAVSAATMRAHDQSVSRIDDVNAFRVECGAVLLSNLGRMPSPPPNKKRSASPDLALTSRIGERPSHLQIDFFGVLDVIDHQSREGFAITHLQRLDHCPVLGAQAL